MPIDKVSNNLNNLVKFSIFWRNVVKYLLMFVTKCSVILKTISIPQKTVNFKKKLPTVMETSKTLYCYQFSPDLTP